MANVDALNAISGGWTEGPGGLLCNPNDGGGIIDSAIGTGAWFVIFNDDRETIEGLATREDAIRAFCRARPFCRICGDYACNVARHERSACGDEDARGGAARP